MESVGHCRGHSQAMKRTLSSSISQPARAALLLVSGLLLSGCGGSAASRNLGDTGDQSPALSTPTATPGPTSPGDFVGSWIGEAEDPLAPPQGTKPAAYHFPSGSTQILLDIPMQDTPQLIFGDALTVALGPLTPSSPELQGAFPPG